VNSAMQPGERRGRVGKRTRERHVSVRLLLAIAIAVPVVIMGGLTAQAVLARTSCTDHPLVLHVAVSDDIAPVIERVADEYNSQGHQANGRCAKIQVAAEQPAGVAAQVDGQASGAGQATVDAWIPDSSLWVGVARTFPEGAKVVQPTGINVARSPLMLVMPPSAAAQIPEYNNTVGWNFLLPASAGGPPAALGVHVEIPDPTQSATGLAALVEVSRLLGSGASARTLLTQFVLSAQASAQFDNPATLAAFVIQAAPPLDARPVTVTSEQAVIEYDAANPAEPLAARYPSGSATAALATPELDYPYVLTSTDPAELAVARQFGTMLRQSYAVALIRHYGFRSSDGVGGTLPVDDGLAEQPLELATAPQPGEAQTALQAWQRLQSGSRDLAVIDVSSAMSAPSGLPNLTLEQELTEAAQLGLALFPDSTQIGLSEVGAGPAGSLPYKSLVSVGPLPGEIGLISRRESIEQIDASLRPQSGPAELNQAILDEYTKMTDGYQSGITNALIVLTAGVENTPGDMPATQLVTDLKSLYKPDRPVELIIIVLGNQGNISAMQQIAAAGGGAAFPVTNPGQIDEVFFEGVSRRICLASGSCAA
jgi:hypothetical protein